jgi:hypothetical protein
MLIARLLRYWSNDALIHPPRTVTGVFGIITTAFAIAFYLFGLIFMGAILIGMLILHPVVSLIVYTLFYLVLGRPLIRRARPLFGALWLLMRSHR